LTVTLRVAPEPLTLVMDVPVMPVVTSAKSLVFTPVTSSEKATMNIMLVRLVGLVLARIIEETTGTLTDMNVAVGVNVGV